MTTTNPFSLRWSHRPRCLRYLLALLATISLSACGGGDENGDQAAEAPGASTPDPSTSPSPAPGDQDQDANPSEGKPIRITFGNTVLAARLHDNATARDLARRSSAADAHLPGPQQRREDRASSPRAVARGRARRARSRSRRHRLLGARWRLGLLLRQRRPVLQRHRAPRRVRQRDGRDQAPGRRLQRHARTRGMTHTAM